jgi:hypothetical protein
MARNDKRADNDCYAESNRKHMKDENKQFTLKPAVAAMSAAIIVILGVLLNIEEVDGALLYSIFFASISLPALAALPILDSYRDDNKIVNAAFGWAAIFGFGGFFLFISSLIIYYSILSGVAFIISGAIWLFVILKFKGNFGGSKSS